MQHHNKVHVCEARSRGLLRRPWLWWPLILTLTTVLLSTSSATTARSSIATACQDTLYPETCASALASVAGDGPAKSPDELFRISLQFAMDHVHSARSLAYNLTFPKHDHEGVEYPPTGTYDCVELLDNTLELLADVMDEKRNPSKEDVETWLSAALTNQATCLESLASRPPIGKELMEARAESLAEFISNSLALHKATTRGKARSEGRQGSILGGRRKLLSDGYPTWLSARDRKLLEAHPSEIKADAVVAQDGSGSHTSINEALAFVSLADKGKGGGRSVIHVKAGTYKEYIRVPTKRKKVMLMGDGKGVSVVVGNRNKNDGWSTYSSATVAGMGAGFIARDLTIVNNAGPSKSQAVALRVGADKSVIYHCSIQGYQDTLYTHSNRQFYKNNDIYGTIDFIFGNSAVVFQGCNISPRKSGSGQKNYITAQGRQDKNQNTGISILGCRIAATGGVSRASTCLGRPWHKYARVVVMESYLDGSIHPNGWARWSGNFALSTLYYGEYRNTGPGSSTSQRVTWPGVHSSMSEAEASKFTVANFIYGNSWLPGTGISYKAGL